VRFLPPPSQKGDRVGTRHRIHFAEVRAKIADLHAMERVLSDAVRRCDAGKASESRADDTMEEGRAQTVLGPLRCLIPDALHLDSPHMGNRPMPVEVQIRQARLEEAAA
jgi:hypothetical protein